MLRPHFLWTTLSLSKPCQSPDYSRALALFPRPNDLQTSDSMFQLRRGTVLDPFVSIGTTAAANQTHVPMVGAMVFAQSVEKSIGQETSRAAFQHFGRAIQRTYPIWKPTSPARPQIKQAELVFYFSCNIFLTIIVLLYDSIFVFTYNR
jgi:hypothetical protein